MNDNNFPALAPPCPICQKAAPLCVCSGVVALDTRLQVVIVQHPQEQDKALGTARLTAAHFNKAEVKVGLSWPSLAKLLGRPADASRWGVLYLGSLKAVDLDPLADVVVLNGKATAAHPDQAAILTGLEGVIVLDGTWSQAKALWWRNAWLLKCQRIILNPSSPSRYGKLRYEPRRDSLSTLEAVALLMSRLENRPEIGDNLTASFDRLLAAYRTLPREDTNHGEKRPHPGRRGRAVLGARGKARIRGRKV